jgi:hypothetical protein
MEKKPWTLTYILVLQTICSLRAPFFSLDQINFRSKLKCHLKLAWINLGSSSKGLWSNLCDWSILLDSHLNCPLNNKIDSLQTCCFSDLHMNSFPHYCSTAFPTPQFLKVTIGFIFCSFFHFQTCTFLHNRHTVPWILCNHASSLCIWVTLIFSQSKHTSFSHKHAL